MRRGGFFVAALLLCAVSATPGASAETDAVAVARALIAAENAHDVAAAVGFFDPAAIVNLPTGALVGRAEIEQWQRELAAGNLRVEITPPVAVTPEVVTFSGTVAFDPFRRLVISHLDATWELIVQHGRVTIFNFSFTPAATARLQAAIAGTGGGSPAASGGGGSGVQSTPATASSGRALALTGTDLGRQLAGVALGTIALGMLLLRATGHGVGRRAPSEIG